MGEAWSWPCAERDIKRLPVQTGKPPARRRPLAQNLTFLDTQCPIKVTQVPASDLDVFLREVCIDRNLPNHYPRHFFQSAFEPDQTVILFYPKHLLPTAFSLQFKLHPYSFKEREEDLTAEVLTYALNTNTREGTLELLGALPFSQSLLMIYGLRPASGTPYRFAVEELSVPFEKQAVCDFLNEHKHRGKEYRASVSVENVIFIIFEHVRDDGKDYHVAPFTQAPSFLPPFLYNEIRKYLFTGVLVHPSAHSMLVIVKPL